MARQPALSGLFGILFGVLVACVSAVPLARAAAPCPAAMLTYYFHFQGGTTPIPAAVFDSTIVNGDGDTTRVSFDHAIGHLALEAVGREWAGVRVNERFDVVGVPVGTLVPVTVVFDLNADVLNRCGGGGCGVYFAATLVTSSDSLIADASLPGPCDSCVKQVSTQLSMPMTITAGTPTGVTFSMLYHTSNVA